MILPKSLQAYDNQSDFCRPLWLLTVLWMTHRNFLIVVRDPSVQALRIVQKIVRILPTHFHQMGNGIVSINGKQYFRASQSWLACVSSEPLTWRSMAYNRFKALFSSWFRKIRSLPCTRSWHYSRKDFRCSYVNGDQDCTTQRSTTYRILLHW